jgi:hypothetical protein
VVDRPGWVFDLIDLDHGQGSEGLRTGASASGGCESGLQRLRL